MAKPIQWGILGLGQIAARFAGSLMTQTDARIAAVLSRDDAKAQHFASACGAAGYSEIKRFLGHAGLDIVYIASPHSLHPEHAIACLEAGKAVLVEKPIAADAAGARAIAEAAKAANRFAMEAMWTRFLPAVQEAKRLAGSGALGALRGFQANLSFPQIEDPRSRLFDPALGGGSLLDLGVYPLSLAIHFLGIPQAVEGQIIRAGSGVDRQASLTMLQGKALSTITCGFDAEGPNDAVLIGEKGRIRLQRPLYAPAALLVSGSVQANNGASNPSPTPSATGRSKSAAWKQLLRPLRQTRLRPLPFSGDGFAHQIAEVHRCLAAGMVQSPVMPLSESVAVLEAVDKVQRR